MLGYELARIYGKERLYRFMNKGIIEKLEEHEREDAVLEARPWRELTRSEFSNGEEMVLAVEEVMRQYGVELKYLHRIYRMLRQRGEIFWQGEAALTRLPIRTGKRFTLRKHSGSFAAYYHTHDFYEMLYVYRGQLIQYKEQESVPEALNQGDFCLMAPGMVHALGPSRERDVVFKIVIPPELFYEAAEVCPRESERLLERLKKDRILVKKTGTRFQTLMELLAQEHLCEPVSREEVVRAYLALLLAELSGFGQGERGLSEKKNSFMAAVEEYLRKENAEASLEDLAARLGYSPDYLGRRIRRECGESFTQLRQRIGMEKAAELMGDVELSVDEVARTLGYRSVSSFYKRFEREYGIAPGAYRKMMWEGETTEKSRI